MDAHATTYLTPQERRRRAAAERRAGNRRPATPADVADAGETTAA
jgi:hypothetical protein